MPDPLKELIDAMRGGLIGVAFAGALAAESFWPAQTIWRTVANVFVGTSISCATAPILIFLLLERWPALQDAQTVMAGALYFWIGLLGMQIVPLVQRIIKKRFNTMGND